MKLIFSFKLYFSVWGGRGSKRRVKFMGSRKEKVGTRTPKLTSGKWEK